MQYKRIILLKRNIFHILFVIKCAKLILNATCSVSKINILHVVYIW